MLHLRLATACLCGLTFAALCGLGGALFWAFDLFTHGTPYGFLVATALLISFLLLKARRRALAAAALVVYFGLGLQPYYLASPAAGDGGEREVRVVLFNLLNGNRAHAPVRDFLRSQEADIMVLQEFDPRWRTALRPFVDAFPHRELQVRRGAFGMAILSRHPISEIRWHSDPERDLPYAEGVIDVDGAPLQFVAVHPYPPVGQSKARLRNDYLRKVTDLIAGEGARVVVGDLNCSPWSPHFRKLCRGADLRDSAQGRGVSPTWFRGGIPIGIPIDHVLVSDEVRVIGREVGPDLGSDHRPVTVDLAF